MDKHGRLSDKEYEYCYSRVPRLCVDLIIFDSDSNILLVNRAMEPHLGLWILPGGRVYKDESLEEAAKRIALTELGVDIEVDNIGCCFEILDDGDYVHSVSIGVECTPCCYDFVLNEQANDYMFFRRLPQTVHEAQANFLQRYYGLA